VCKPTATKTATNCGNNYNARRGRSASGGSSPSPRPPRTLTLNGTLVIAGRVARGRWIGMRRQFRPHAVDTSSSRVMATSDALPAIWGRAGNAASPTRPRTGTGHDLLEIAPAGLHALEPKSPSVRSTRESPLPGPASRPGGVLNAILLCPERFPHSAGRTGRALRRGQRSVLHTAVRATTAFDANNSSRRVSYGLPKPKSCRPGQVRE